ncbi:dihydrolipoyllysine-residue acetyltransferase [Microbulbifer flavimaris]|uniref:Acetyltransferase component of pyruvate dehydrogenase complex n=1 Tax=Microbulbifer flavimaris TaxID=1781068 RepID=A0ABX4HZN5_9GAMM|nr:MULTISPECIES: dihydrolipoyllysine-residue acetyltransferase [Microbulbifer]KUJ83395.1 dihydrolipoamide acetyltransferase [Microbulbifer sp. ZGT114]PCO05551.1 dihydrolipoyllysine-residue acetyltransferase [Microbulbifer flavimaris]
MAKEVIKVPDLGGADQVDVIEITVAVGDTVAAEDSLIVVEGDKASMDVPAPMAGKILSISVSEGDQVSEGDVIAEIETEAAGEDSSAGEEKSEPAQEEAPEEEEATASEESGDEEESAGGEEKEEGVTVPDLGGADAVDVIEISVQPGDEVAEGDSLIVVEGDKASMDVPAPFAGTVVSIDVKEGDKVSTGDKLGVVKTSGGGGAKKAEAPKSEKKPATEAPKKAEPKESVQKAGEEPPAAPQKDHALERDLTVSAEVYAGPAVRKLARELGVTLSKVKPSGPRNRVTKDDLHAYVKEQVKKAESGAVGVGTTGIAKMPEIDFSQFGPVTTEPMSKIHKLTAANMARNWLNVPHVTQFDDADITELEEFRKSMKAEAEKRGVKLTPVPFLLKAAAAALRAEPSFNVSLHNDGEHIVRKDYVHIGMAVDTPKGLMVPVIRDVDKKGLYELAEEATAMAVAAREGKLKPRDMQGACFTISSLGSIGGTGFTPIVNAPEVGILGVSKLSVQPVWNGKEFVPRQMLPLALSYDHRAVNGGDAGRFMTYLVSVLGDVRKLLL